MLPQGRAGGGSLGPMIKNIIFDFGGVLLDLRPDRCMEQFTAIGFPQIREMLTLAHQGGVLGEVEEGNLTIQQMCDAIRQEADPSMPVPTNQQIVGAFCSMADGVPAYRLDFVYELKQRGYNVDALSNTNPVHWGYCQRYFIEAGYIPSELFQHLWLSCDLHLVKPDPRIFEAILKDAGYDPDETLFIDDNPKNCEVAESFGIHTYCAPIRADWRAELNQVLRGCF